MIISMQHIRYGRMTVLWFFVFLMIINGCTVPMGNSLPASDVNKGVGIQPLGQSYRLGPNDVVRIQVFDEPELTTETVVSGEGKVNFPLLGQLHVGGKTIREVEGYISNQLKNGYIKDPKVSVYIVHYRNIFVSGEVKTPGAYPYQEGLTILRAITLAGGFTPNAAKSSTQVLRMDNGREIRETVSLDSFIRPDDIVIVPESFF